MLEITKENFKKEVSVPGKVVVIDFWAPWCMPCKILAPAVEKLADELIGKATIAKCNVDDSPELATDISVLNIPTLVLFKDGVEASRIVGVNSKEAIVSRIKEFVD